MGKIFCVMGKSATGKDTIYQKLLHENELKLQRIIPYTTRPIREGEEDGREYHFCTEEDVQRLEAEGKIVELRAYDTVYGIWKYFTVNDGDIQLEKENYLLIGTLEAYIKIRDYFGSQNVVPIYIEVEDGERLIRAISREKEQDVPKYEEMCRRFLADAKDFSEEKLKAAGIEKRFVNLSLETTLAEVEAYMKEMM
ncbi:MAG: guanylate kinase [Agathobacter sp.]|nr:guanylate kinase [Agathobacter sp.]MBQ6812193.1 guanylate kinase [Agathobacter sp.]